MKDILRIVFAQQYEDARRLAAMVHARALFAAIQDRHSHGDVIVWPLKALCDYIEATGDFAFLDEPIALAARRRFRADRARTDPIAAHVDKLLATVRERFIPGTHLIRYGEGDWNDSLQPADPAMRDWMVSSWTVALLLPAARAATPKCCARRPRRTRRAELDALAAAMRADFNRHLMRDGVVAGYALFDPDGGEPELLLHPSDTRTGLRYSLLPMTQASSAGCSRTSRRGTISRLIREHLLFPDGARLMDRPVAYHGGPETDLPARGSRPRSSAARSASMYMHAHLRYGEAMATLGEADALWEALAVVNPIAVTERLANASLRQRNAYFSSSDAAFPDRYEASAEWERVKAGDDRGRRRLAHLFERPGPLRQSARLATPSGSGATSASGSWRRCCRGRWGR